MEFNKGIIEIIERRMTDPHYARDVYFELRKRWPQINHATRVEWVDWITRRFEIMGEMTRQPIPRWFDRSGIKAWLWRVVGTMLRRETIKQRGQQYGFPQFAPLPPIAQYTIELERFGWRSGFGESVSLRCGYDPRIDTFYYSGD